MAVSGAGSVGSVRCVCGPGAAGAEGRAVGSVGAEALGAVSVGAGSAGAGSVGAGSVGDVEGVGVASTETDGSAPARRREPRWHFRRSRTQRRRRPPTTNGMCAQSCRAPLGDDPAAGGARPRCPTRHDAGLHRSAWALWRMNSCYVADDPRRDAAGRPSPRRADVSADHAGNPRCAVQEGGHRLTAHGLLRPELLDPAAHIGPGGDPDRGQPRDLLGERRARRTSWNGGVTGAVNAGDPLKRYRNAAIASRVTGSAGRNSFLPPPTSVPVEMPLDANQAISL